MSDNRPVRETAGWQNARRKQRGCGCAVLLAVLLVGLGFVATVFLAGYSYMFRSVSLKTSQETTYITEPLTADGQQVDYLAAWERDNYPENIAGEENGYRLIVQHLGHSREADAAHVAQLRRKLGLLAGESRPDMTFVEPYDFLQAYVASEDFDEALIRKLADESAAQERAEDRIGEGEFDPSHFLYTQLDKPWTLRELPMMEAWLTDNGPALDLIGKAVRKPTFHIPFARASEDELLINLQPPVIAQVRAFARALSARAHYRIATGDIDGAIGDKVTCKRLGRRVGHAGPLVQTLVGIAIEGIADAIGVADSLEHPPTKQQLQRLVDELDDLPPKSKLETALLFGRYTTLDVVQAMAHGSPAVRDLDLPSNMPSGRGCDWNVVARRVNGHWETMLTTGARPALPQNPNPMAIVSVRARSEAVADILAGALLPAHEAFREAGRRSTCVERMQRITLALLLGEREQGTLPAAYTVDARGRPLHSWRVTLLPYLGQRELHDKIRLDEPWDSDHNRKFHDQPVPFYQCPSAGLPPGRTTYSVAVGPEMPFEANQGKKLSDFGPKSARLILVVEATEAVCWMDPTCDVPQAVADAGISAGDRRSGESGIGIGSKHPGGANFGLRNGAVRFLSANMDNQIFRGLLRGATDKTP
jgi:hypothetical protein